MNIVTQTALKLTTINVNRKVGGWVKRRRAPLHFPLLWFPFLTPRAPLNLKMSLKGKNQCVFSSDFYVCWVSSIVACGWQCVVSTVKNGDGRKNMFGSQKNVHHCLSIRWRTWSFESKPSRKHEEEKINFNFGLTTVCAGLGYQWTGLGKMWSMQAFM